MKKINVLVLITVMDRAGAETMMMNYLRNINREKIHMDFLINREQKADYEDEIEKLGGRIYHMCPIYPGKFHRYKKEFRNFLEEHPGYDVIHSNLEERSYFAFKIAKKMGIPVRVAHAHSAPCGRNMKMIMRLYFRRKLQKYCTHKVACGEKAAKWLFGSDADLVEMESFVNGENHSKNTVVLMKNAVDTDKFSYSTDVREKVRKKMKISRDTLVIGHVGRFTHDKNQSFLIDIFKNVNSLNKKSAMMLIGGGKPKEEISYKEEIERKVQQLGLKGKVKLLGVREDINELMQAMDILVMPSRTEGFPVTLVEAQAVGLCCLVSDAVGYDINMTEKIQYKSLEEDASWWAQKILSMTADGQNREAESIPMKEKVIERGYEIADAAKDLEAFYEYLAG